MSKMYVIHKSKPDLTISTGPASARTSRERTESSPALCLTTQRVRPLLSGPVSPKPPLEQLGPVAHRFPSISPRKANHMSTVSRSGPLYYSHKVMPTTEEAHQQQSSAPSTASKYTLLGNPQRIDDKSAQPPSIPSSSSSSLPHPRAPSRPQSRPSSRPASTPASRPATSGSGGGGMGSIADDALAEALASLVQAQAATAKAEAESAQLRSEAAAAATELTKQQQLHLTQQAAQEALQRDLASAKAEAAALARERASLREADAKRKEEEEVLRLRVRLLEEREAVREAEKQVRGDGAVADKAVTSEPNTPTSVPVPTTPAAPTTTTSSSWSEVRLLQARLALAAVEREDERRARQEDQAQAARRLADAHAETDNLLSRLKAAEAVSSRLRDDLDACQHRLRLTEEELQAQIKALEQDRRGTVFAQLQADLQAEVAANKARAEASEAAHAAAEEAHERERAQTARELHQVRGLRARMEAATMEVGHLRAELSKTQIELDATRDAEKAARVRAEAQEEAAAAAAARADEVEAELRRALNEMEMEAARRNAEMDRLRREAQQGAEQSGLVRRLRARIAGLEDHVQGLCGEVPEEYDEERYSLPEEINGVQITQHSISSRLSAMPSSPTLSWGSVEAVEEELGDALDGELGEEGILAGSWAEVCPEEGDWQHHSDDDEIDARSYLTSLLDPHVVADEFSNASSDSH